MKKIAIIFIILLTVTIPGWGQSAGTGFSVFVPESLYKYGDGSVSMEQSLEFSFGLGGILSLPVGVTYNTNYGLMVDGAYDVESPWFYSDSIMPYIMLKAHIPLGVMYVEAFGGIATNYNLTLRPIEGNIEKDLSSGSNQAVLDDDSIEYENAIGIGYVAGGSLGVKIGKISVDLSLKYRCIWHDLDLIGRYDSVSQVNAGENYSSNARLMMRGISIGIGGSFEF